MPNVTFTGEGKHDPEQITFRGVTFPLGVPVAVSEDVAAKLRANRHFYVSEDGLPCPMELHPEAEEPPKRKPGRPPKIK